MALIEEYLAGLQECLEELSTHDIEEAANIIFDAYRKRKRIFIMGNGGSATMAFITSLANDIGYDRIFEEQLIDQLVKGDVVIGISASGNSPNVLRAIEYARKNGAVTIGFIGFGGGKLKDLADKSIVLSKKNYQQVEDAHMVLAHIIPCRIKEKIEAL